MKWLTALVLGAVVGVIMPLFFGGREGFWMDSWAGWGTVRPFANSPGLLFSVPVFLIASFIFRAFFNWHSR